MGCYRQPLLLMPVWGKGKGQRVGHQKIDEHLGFKFLFLCVNFCAWVTSRPKVVVRMGSRLQLQAARPVGICICVFSHIMVYLCICVWVTGGSMQIRSGGSYIPTPDSRLWGIIVARSGGSQWQEVAAQCSSSEVSHPFLPDYTIDRLINDYK